MIINYSDQKKEEKLREVGRKKETREFREGREMRRGERGEERGGQWISVAQASLCLRQTTFCGY